LRDQVWKPSNILPINTGLHITHKSGGVILKKKRNTINPKPKPISTHTSRPTHLLAASPSSLLESQDRAAIKWMNIV